jgi:cation:H+ antiporter
MWWDLLWLFIGFALLLSCGELLVKGAVGMAYKANLSTLVVGMTVVSLGTSAPELLVSLKAAVTDYHDISIGNVIGSNIANIGLVLGTTVIIFPIAADRDTLRLDWPAMTIASFLFFVFILDAKLVFWEGVIMILALGGYITYIIRRSRKRGGSYHEEGPRISMSAPRILFYVGLGIAGLALGSDLLIEGAVGIAEAAGIDEHVIGVTLVAFGTSVPELFTSTIAAFRKKGNISVGNLIGSNLFNILFILGTVSIVHPLKVAQRVIEADVFWMLGIALLLFPLIAIGRKITRFEGGLLVLSYLAYIYFVLAPAISN